MINPQMTSSAYDLLDRLIRTRYVDGSEKRFTGRSTVALLDESGAVVECYGYAPFYTPRFYGGDGTRRMGLAGKKLEGAYYLEVPVQSGPVSQKVLDYARKYRVTIRDIAGHEY